MVLLSSFLHTKHSYSALRYVIDVNYNLKIRNERKATCGVDTSQQSCGGQRRKETVDIIDLTIRF